MGYIIDQTMSANALILFSQISSLFLSRPHHPHPSNLSDSRLAGVRRRQVGNSGTVGRGAIVRLA